VNPKETPIKSSLFGFVKEGPCPGCGTLIYKRVAASAEALCSVCGNYSEFGEKTLRPLDQDRVAKWPAYAAPTSWPDIVTPDFAALKHPIAALTDMILTKKDGVRSLDARWPEGCCVCGKPATRAETIAQHLTYVAGGLIAQQRETTVVAQGVPHCAEHKDGAQFERVVRFADVDLWRLGLFFRSYAYQIKFRENNPWKWREAAK
jgi:hypothetical protein